MNIEDLFEEYRKDISDIKDDLTEIKVWLARNTESLEYHIKRTNILEQRMDHVDSHVTMMQTIAKVAVAAAGVIGVIYSILEIYKILSKQ